MTASFDDADVRAVAAGAAFAHLAVASRLGPHVTPEAYATSRGWLWCTTSAGTVKARVLRRDPRVGVLLTDGERSVAVEGRAHVVRLSSPVDALRLDLRAGPGRFAAGMAAYTRGNARYLLGYLADATSVPAAWLPQSRVAIGIEPLRVHHVEQPPQLSAVGGRAARLPLDRLPDGPAALAASAGQAVVALEGARGPVALPGWWDPAADRAEVAASALDLVGPLASARLAVAVDRAARLRPTGMVGAMVRGEAAQRRRSGTVHLDVSPERVAWWDGFRSGSEAA